MGIFEPEELVGRHWHRLVGNRSSYPHHPQAAVALEGLRHRLAVFYRGLGGDHGVRLAAGAKAESGHRLSLLDRIGLGVEKVDKARLDGEVLQLPPSIDLFPEARLNELLYEWLAAFFAHAEPLGDRPDDPLQADVQALRATARAVRRALARFPGLRPIHTELAAATLAARPKRTLPKPEREVEEAVAALLADPDATAHRMLNEAVPLELFKAQHGYQPFLPVPLWGEAINRPPGEAVERPDDDSESGGGEEKDSQRRKASRRDSDQTNRDDPLILNRFDTMMSIAEMVNLNRKTEDDDQDSAQKAVEETDEISLGQNDRKTSTKLKLDLDIAPGAADTGPIRAEITYPEWDYHRGVYHKDYCRVVAEPAAEEGEDWEPDDASRRRIRAVRRQFEALRPRRMVFPGQPDGDEVDLNALVRSHADKRAGGIANERVYLQVRNALPDLAVAVLVDVSLSTDSWIEDRRVLDVEKEALLALTHGLTACGDSHAVYAFTSKKRSFVNVKTLKDFDETVSPKIDRRIQALKPGHYTRIGAALRHVTTKLAERPNRQKLVILLSDGKPNDMDHYEGRYGIEDTRKAVLEARKEGLAVFGITVDAHARDYFPTLFGRGAYAIFPHISRLTVALPALYRQLAR
ncbi:VWA domain-containing protein [Azospirillum sp. TSO22-1]|uniref:nitric oxide reductase activation protein NorD n=1 Tax=Azospirillum sp. TSO22-1 TaxID=716789 RepID=UPI000D604123|nr:VWA domain-containing protein [Azospirillum sp. TSO22-1]PWC38666.1 protein norD [Azospirillum sp. TSO22-1]